MRHRFLIFVLIVIAIVVAIFVFWPQGFQMARNWVAGGSGQPGAGQQAQQAQQNRPPPQVGVMEVKAETVPLPVEYAGRVAGFREVEVRPRVSGALLKREFEEGAKVEQGQMLFRIDPATYKVALAQAEAQRAQAQAQATQAEENFKRIEELAGRQVSTEQQLEQAKAQRDLQRAAVQLAEAQMDAAKLNIEYTTVNAPVAGVTALLSPPEGTLVQAQQTLLTTITQLNPAYVNFSVTDSEYQAFQKLNQRRKDPIKTSDLTVKLHYGDGRVYGPTGRIDMAAQRVDPQTGTIQARAIFPNTDDGILPGQFVRVVINGVTLPDAIVIPERAINQGPQGSAVFVVNDKNIAEARAVKLAQQVASGYVVSEGLKSGERIVVDGLIRVRPGAPVNPAPPGQAPAAQQGGQPQQSSGNPAGAAPSQAAAGGDGK